jgi:hypothetical protein
MKSRFSSYGERTRRRALIYSGWKQIDEVPHEARLLGYVDFGFDPIPQP